MDVPKTLEFQKAYYLQGRKGVKGNICGQTKGDFFCVSWALLGVSGLLGYIKKG
jgi:hypothetical protein